MTRRGSDADAEEAGSDSLHPGRAASDDERPTAARPHRWSDRLVAGVAADRFLLLPIYIEQVWEALRCK